MRGIDGRGTIGLPLEALQSVIRDIPKPIIARVQGYSIGGGNVLALLCDLTVASEQAIFGSAQYVVIVQYPIEEEKGSVGSSSLHVKHYPIFYVCFELQAGHSMMFPSAVNDSSHSRALGYLQIMTRHVDSWREANQSLQLPATLDTFMVLVSSFNRYCKFIVSAWGTRPGVRTSNIDQN